MSESTVEGTVAIIGIGEAGAEIARDLLAARWFVRAFDPRPAREVPGAELAESTADAVRGADLVLSLTTAEAARAAASAAAPALRPGAVYADLNTGSTRLKRDVAVTVEDAGALFADVAVMAPVPGRGLRTPLLASGSGAARLAELLRPLGAHVDVVGPEPGAAAERKLLRSVFVKGLAAALLEGAAAARAAGCEEWFLADAGATLAAADERLVDRLRAGSRVHAARRVHELDDAAELLGELGVRPRVTGAARAVLAELAG
jgi:3-hydroxyisobutyrate dehydrogenase-like beta-hydroxyacid dehydrogenase